MSSRLFVGNINYTATEEELINHFSAAGNVLSASIVFDRATGKPRGFGFVEMASPEEARRAVAELHEKEFQGRQLSVSEARPREDRPFARPYRGGEFEGREQRGGARAG